MDTLYWGIVSCGNISHDFVNALKDPTSPAEANNVVVAVAARQLDRAKTFGENHSISTIYGSYQELADNGDIDVVYISNVTAQHYDVCKMMLEAGKHVLCEKSLTTCYSQSKELFDLAASKKLFLMEAVWSNFFPTYQQLQSHLAAGCIGQVTYVEASFGFDLSTSPRFTEQGAAGGASFDFGLYLINLVRLVFNREKPIEIIAKGGLFPSGVDSSWDAIIVFSGNRRALLQCSTKYKLSNTARITGLEGCIEIPESFYCPIIIKTPSGKDITMRLPNQPKHEYNYENSAGLSYECAAVSEAIRAGKLECKEYTAEDSLYIAEILEEINKQIGAKI